MRNLLKFMIPMIAILLGACSQKDPVVGIIPLEGVKVSGQVVEADGASGVLLKTDGQRTALLPNSWQYRQGDQIVEDVSVLQPGTQVQAYAPQGDSQLVAATDKNLVLTSHDDTFTLPYEAFPESRRQIPVRVQAYGGQQQVVPLHEAIYGNGYTVLPYDGFTSSTFPQADRYGVSRAVVVGEYDGSPLAIIPGTNNLQAVRLPTEYYPVPSLQTNQPVRFTYQDNNVQVNSWDSLTNGQLDIGDLLLAGTLLKALPGQAVVEIGNRPVTVPWNNLSYQGAPVAWNAINPGSPVDLRYYPGVYDIADYRDDTFTMVYNQQVLQIPAQSLPNYIYQRPVYVQYKDGGVHRVPFQKARNLAQDQQCQFLVSPKHAKKYKGWQNADPRYVQNLPGRQDYVLVGNPHDGFSRVQRRSQPQNWSSVAFAPYQPVAYLPSGKHNDKSIEKAQKQLQKAYDKQFKQATKNNKPTKYDKNHNNTNYGGQWTSYDSDRKDGHSKKAVKANHKNAKDYGAQPRHDGKKVKSKDYKPKYNGKASVNTQAKERRAPQAKVRQQPAPKAKAVQQHYRQAKVQKHAPKAKVVQQHSRPAKVQKHAPKAQAPVRAASHKSSGGHGQKSKSKGKGKDKS